MAVVSLKKTRTIISENIRYQFLDFLQERGYFHVENISGEHCQEIKSFFERESSDLDFTIAQVESTIKELKKHDTKKKSFRLMFLGEKEILTQEEINRIVNNFYYKDVVSNVSDQVDTFTKAKNHIKSLELEFKQLTPWKKYNAPLSQKLQTKTASGFLFKIDNINFEKLKEDLKSFHFGHIKCVDQDDRCTYAEAVFLNEYEENFREIFAKYNVEYITLPLRSGTASEELTRIEQTIKSEKQIIIKAKDVLAKDAHALKNLKVIRDFLVTKKTRQETRRNFYRSGKTVIIEGWIPEVYIEDAKEKLNELSGDCYDFSIIKSSEDEMPVELQSEGAAEMFMPVTSIYGLPKPTELDPTPFLATFFIFFFALCLTDAFYGITLSLLCFGALSIFKIPKADRRLFRLLGYGGLLTFVLGILFGGYFGLTVDQMPEWMTYVNENGEGRFFLQVINPVSETLNFLIFSFAVGYIHILFGIGMDAWWKMKRGQKLEALLGPITWVWIMLTGILAIALGGAFLYALLFGVAVIVFTSGRALYAGKSPLMKAVMFPVATAKGILGLYDAVGYVSDILSYSRLMALGLGTGIIAYAVNIIAGIAMEMIPVQALAIIVMIFILIVGHLGNLALSSLGAFVHSGRLQYVEFFGKFMEGGGKAFKPFTKERKYTIDPRELD